jgi:hypothetical protein
MSVNPYRRLVCTSASFLRRANSVARCRTTDPPTVRRPPASRAVAPAANPASATRRLALTASAADRQAQVRRASPISSAPSASGAAELVSPVPSCQPGRAVGQTSKDSGRAPKPRIASPCESSCPSLRELPSSLSRLSVARILRGTIRAHIQRLGRVNWSVRRDYRSAHIPNCPLDSAALSNLSCTWLSLLRRTSVRDVWVWTTFV